MFVQFEDSNNLRIIACFSCAQDADGYPNQGIVEESDDRYKSYCGELPESMRPSNQTIPG